MKALLAQILTCSLLLHAETNLERGKRVVNEAVAGLGGSRFLNVEVREESGRAYSLYRDQISGLSIATIYTRYDSGVTDTAHNLAVREREYFGKKQDFGALFTEKEAFDISFRGARPLPDDQIAKYKETTLHNIFYILRIRLNEPGMVFESRGADVLQNTPVEIVDITDADNRVTTVYFDQINKWPVRQVFIRREAQTKLTNEEVTIFSKYRTMDGISWPCAIQRQRDGETIYEIFSDSISFDKKTPPGAFELPGGIKLLKPI